MQRNDTITIYRGLETDNETTINLCNKFLTNGVAPRRKKQDNGSVPTEIATVDEINNYINGRKTFEELKAYVLKGLDLQVNRNDQRIALPCTYNQDVAEKFAFGDTTTQAGIQKTGSGSGFVLCMEVPMCMLIDTSLYYYSAWQMDKEDEVLFPAKICMAHIKEIQIFENRQSVKVIKNKNFNKNAPMFNETADTIISIFCKLANCILDENGDEACVESIWHAGYGDIQYDEGTLRSIWQNEIHVKPAFNNSFESFKSAVDRKCNGSNINNSDAKKLLENYRIINNAFSLFNAKRNIDQIDQKIIEKKSFSNMM